MKVAAIICEYNPFHNGHEYLIQSAKEQTKADYIIAIMSGNFVQRGEPAIIDKWARAKSCLRAGVDMVVELPCFASFAPANLYAYYGVKTACQLGVVDYLVFGSEKGLTANELRKLAEEADGNNAGFTEKLRENLASGMSYAASISKSYGFDPGPNDILGIEYLRALTKLNSNIVPFPILRTQSKNVTSASSLRVKISSGEINHCRNFMSENSFNILKEEIQSGKAPVLIRNYENAIIASLRSKTTEDIRKLPFVSEGLEYAIYKNALAHGTLDGLISASTCARYTSSRIRRICLASLLGIKAQDLNHSPGFIKIIGFRKNAGSLIDAITNKSVIPVDISLSKLATSDKYFAGLAARCTDVYTLGYPQASKRLGDKEYTHSGVFEI